MTARQNPFLSKKKPSAFRRSVSWVQHLKGRIVYSLGCFFAAPQLTERTNKTANKVENQQKYNLLLRFHLLCKYFYKEQIQLWGRGEKGGLLYVYI